MSTSPCVRRALIASLLGTLLIATGCGQQTLPTSPSAAVPATALQSLNFDADLDDSPLNGSEVQIVGFDTVSLRLDYVTAKGVASAAVFDGNSLFRSAQTAKYAPVDPCRQFAIDYNTAAPTGDSNGVFQAISAMAGSGCFARVQEDKLVPPNPTAPIKSFRPLSAF